MTTQIYKIRNTVLFTKRFIILTFIEVVNRNYSYMAKPNQ